MSPFEQPPQDAELERQDRLSDEDLGGIVRNRRIDYSTVIKNFLAKLKIIFKFFYRLTESKFFLFLKRIVLLLAIPLFFTFLINRYILTRLAATSITGLNNTINNIEIDFADAFKNDKIVRGLNKIPEGLLYFDFFIENRLSAAAAAINESDAEKSSYMTLEGPIKAHRINDEVYDASLLCDLQGRRYELNFGNKLRMQGVGKTEINELLKKMECEAKFQIDSDNIEEEDLVLFYLGRIYLTIKPSFFSLVLIYLFSFVSLIGILRLIKEAIMIGKYGWEYFLKNS